MTYNENDKFAAAWLRALIEAGELPAGVVDERSIEEIEPGDCGETAHFFAGIGGWPLALQLAGWRGPVWTGSCPCQPFSAAGKRQGEADERHLWPAWFRLISECRPPAIFGEQVASNDGVRWLARVRTDLEGMGYAVGAADLPAACVGAPHKRQRLFFVATLADAEAGRRGKVDTLPRGRDEGIRPQGGERSERGGGDGTLADTNGRNPSDRDIQRSGKHRQQQENGGAGAVGYTDCRGQQGDEELYGESQAGEQASRRANTMRSGLVTIQCLDGKARRIEPGIHPLAHGVPGRVGRLRGYGNAIVPQAGAAFVRAFMGVAR